MTETAMRCFARKTSRTAAGSEVVTASTTSALGRGVGSDGGSSGTSGWIVVGSGVQGFKRFRRSCSGGSGVQNGCSVAHSGARPQVVGFQAWEPNDAVRVAVGEVGQGSACIRTSHD